MLKLGSNAVDYKIAPPESLSVIGSNSIETSGDLYSIDINSITKPSNKRNKRIIDLGSSFLLLLSFPISIFFVRNPISLLSNIFSVFFGRKTWIGYGNQKPEMKLQKLPAIKTSVLTPSDSLNEKSANKET